MDQKPTMLLKLIFIKIQSIFKGFKTEKLSMEPVTYLFLLVFPGIASVLGLVTDQGARSVQTKRMEIGKDQKLAFLCTWKSF